MNVGVAYADKFKQVWLKLEVPDGSTVHKAIQVAEWQGMMLGYVSGRIRWTGVCFTLQGPVGVDHRLAQGENLP